MTTMTAMTEAEFLAQVIELAELYGWEAAHFRAAMTSRGWRTPVQGSMGKGWPDLVLLRIRDRRLIFAELKRDGAKTTYEQDRVLHHLGWLVGPRESDLTPKVDVFTWRPADFDQIAQVLR